MKTAPGDGGRAGNAGLAGIPLNRKKGERPVRRHGKAAEVGFRAGTSFIIKGKRETRVEPASILAGSPVVEKGGGKGKQERMERN